MTFYTPDHVICNGSTFKKYILRDEIDKRVAEIANELNKDFQDKKPIFIGILNGAFVFLSDIMRHVNVPCEVDFMKLSSYGDAKVSSGEVTELKHIDADLADRHVILVEDIVDTGLSINYLMHKVKQHNPASVNLVTLLHKAEATKYSVQLDYIGFTIPNKFVLGYGLDYAQEGRNLAQIYMLDENQSGD